MQRNRFLYIVFMAVAVLVLAGLILLAANLDKLNPNAGATVPTPTAPTGPSYPTGGAWDVTYEQYLAMTQAEKDAHYYRFENPNVDFFVWYDAAKEEYDANKNEIQIGPGGEIDIGSVGKK